MVAVGVSVGTAVGGTGVPVGVLAGTVCVIVAGTCITVAAGLGEQAVTSVAMMSSMEVKTRRMALILSRFG
jgi:hypothetical protein